MAFLDNYVDGGNFKTAEREALERHAAVVARVRALTTENLAKAALKFPQDYTTGESSSDRGINHEFDWVTVADPRETGKEISIQPVIEYRPGDEDGLYIDLVLRGRNNEGELCEIGRMAVMDQVFTADPTLLLNLDGKPGTNWGANPEEEVAWTSADAALFLTMVETSLPRAL